MKPRAFSRILVPVDFSTATNAALEEAFAWAKPSGGAVWLLHVNEPVPFMGAMEACVLSKDDAAMAADAKASLDRLRRQLEAQGVATEAIVRSGKRVTEICRAAELLAADLIVMGRHRHAWWEGAISKSTVEEVLKSAPCSVLLLPAVGTADDALYAPVESDMAEDEKGAFFSGRDRGRKP